MEYKELIERYSNYIINIYKVGSSVLPWLKNPNDEDYAVYINCTDSKVKNELKKHNPQNGHYIVRDLTKKQHPKIYSYQTHFLLLLYGEDLEFNKYDIFENEQEYKQYLIRYCSIRQYTPERKLWYHILTAIYLFDNKGYFITDDQAENIQLCHDNKMTLELYDYIKTRLNEWEKDIPKTELGIE